MGIVCGALDRVILVGGILAGGTVPGFIAQFRQRLGGRLDQVLKDLQPFQEIANQMHDGSLEALVRYHLKSTDPTFRQEGEAISAMQYAAQTLGDAVQILQGPLPQQIRYLATRADRDMLRATWDAFTPVFSFTPESLLLAGGVGLSLWLLFMGVAMLIRRVLHPRPRPEPEPFRSIHWVGR